MKSSQSDFCFHMNKANISWALVLKVEGKNSLDKFFLSYMRHVCVVFQSNKLLKIK